MLEQTSLEVARKLLHDELDKLLERAPTYGEISLRASIHAGQVSRVGTGVEKLTKTTAHSPQTDPRTN